MLRVTDTGECHDGLDLHVDVWAEGFDGESEIIDEFYKDNENKGKCFLSICSVSLNPNQTQELIMALQQALEMRKFDEESKTP